MVELMSHQDIMARNLRAGIAAIKAHRMTQVWADPMIGPLWFSVSLYEKGFDTALSKEDRDKIKAREMQNDRRAARIRRLLHIRRAA